jgi:hypothetical protein
MVRHGVPCWGWRSGSRARSIASLPMAERAPPLSQRFVEARDWATQLHAGQLRKGPLQLPYITHPIAVAELVRLDGGSEDQQIGALLHDAIEDCGVTAEQITERFERQVAAIVAACSDCGPTGRGDSKPPWFERKLDYIEALGQKPREALLVVAADKFHNTSATLADAKAGRLDWGIFKAGIQGSLWYFQALSEALAELLPASRSVQLLGQAVAELLQLPEVVAAARGEEPADWARRFPQPHFWATITPDGTCLQLFRFDRATASEQVFDNTRRLWLPYQGDSLLDALEGRIPFLLAHQAAELFEHAAPLLHAPAAA